MENSPPGIHTMPSGALPAGGFLFATVGSNSPALQNTCTCAKTARIAAPKASFITQFRVPNGSLPCMFFRRSYQLLLLVEVEFLTGKRWRQVAPFDDLFEPFLHEQRLHSGCGQVLRAFLQPGHDLRMLNCDIVLLRWVQWDVVKLRR